MTAPDKSVRQSDLLDPTRAQMVQAALDLPHRTQKDEALPPFFHQLYFWDPQPPDRLGRDGHPKLGGIIPDLGLPRRMWAGGRLTFHAPLLAGHDAQKTSTCEDATHKRGRSGPLGFVTLRHDIHQNGRLCVTEWQDLVYREDPAPPEARTAAPAPAKTLSAGGSRATETVETGSPNPAQALAPAVRLPEPTPARRDETYARSWSFDTTLLFRYSAATCNGHRIHYDLDYAQTVEGYRGLVVHGPLLAQGLMLQAANALGSLRSFSFRAHSPVMHFETVAMCHTPDGDGLAMWVRGPDGRLAMSATASAD